MADKRPSGATLRVLKIFDNAKDFQRQLERTEVLPAALVVPVRVEGGSSFSMPLVNPRVPTTAFFDLGATFSALWQQPADTNPSRHAYHEYVMDRGCSPLLEDRARILGATLLDEALAAADKLFQSNLALRPLESNEFVHGDATLSNCVMTDDGVRLIDLSPRPAPAEAEVDIAKLWFSSMGFDTDAETGAWLRGVLKSFPRVQRASWPLVNYYFATHIVRVLSKEPPTTLERVEFYRKVIDHVKASQA